MMMKAALLLASLCSLKISYNCLASLVKILLRVYNVIAINGLLLYYLPR